ncbi:uncharacterized protein STEHIDRAFT_37269, partial [Stereum hirsutum FP-91666 SS1]|uniref:uncharacterized protein n=1 Tax=Stereum hirsutum (strain FP-91666) TaxID=721885 RepID=UPI000440A09B
MFIYNGKLSWFHLVEKEDFTIVVPAGFAQKDPICAHWQWTIDPSNSKGKQNTSRFSMINNIVNTVADEYKFSFSFGYYSFDAVVSRDFRTLSTTMRDITNDRSGPHTLILQYSDTSRIPSTVVYTGKLDWLHEAVNKMITLVVSSGVSALTNGSFVGMYHQWTVDSSGNKKGSHPINSTFDFSMINNIVNTVADEYKFSFSFGYYSFDAVVSRDFRTLSTTMRDITNDRS